MKALAQHRSLRQRLSWWLALQSFAGLGVVCLAVYLVTEFNFRDRQEETLAQKENVIRHLLVDGKEHGDSEDLAHKLDDFLVGHGELSLEVARADGIVLYAHTRNQNRLVKYGVDNIAITLQAVIHHDRLIITKNTAFFVQ